MWFALLEVFVARESHPNTPQDHVKEGYKLGAWGNGQRTSYTKGTLSEEQVARLEAVGFVWDQLGAACFDDPVDNRGFLIFSRQFDEVCDRTGF
jgi:hypothetical protein